MLGGHVLLVKDSRFKELSVITGGILIQQDVQSKDDVDLSSGPARWGRNNAPRSYLGLGHDHIMIGGARMGAIRETGEETNGVLIGVLDGEASVIPSPVDVDHAPDPLRGQRGRVIGRYYVVILHLDPWARRRGWTVEAGMDDDDVRELALAEIRGAPRAVVSHGGESIEDWRFEPLGELLREGSPVRATMWVDTLSILDSVKCELVARAADQK